MNKIINLKIFSFIIFLTLLFIQGCGEFSKDRPPTNLDVNLANYKVKPKVSFSTTYAHRGFYTFDYPEKDNDTFRRVVEKVIKENKLFDLYSFEASDAKNADYRIDLSFIKTDIEPPKVDPLGFLEAFFHLMTLTIAPLPMKVHYSLSSFVYDKSVKELYSYTCENDATVTQYSSNPPSGMIEKMVKEALFNVINNSGIIVSYKLEP